MKRLHYISTTKILNNPRNLNKLLFNKYGQAEKDYNYIQLECLISRKICRLFILYKEYFTLECVDEFLNKFYLTSESTEKLPKIAEYYKNYIRFFSNPFFRDFHTNKIMQDFGEMRAEVYYKNKYREKVKITSSNYMKNKVDITNSRHSGESAIEIQEKKTNAKLFFNSSVKKIIEPNVKTFDNPDKSTLALQTESNASVSKLEFLTKRSKDESLLDILSQFEEGHAEIIKLKRILRAQKISKREKTSESNKKEERNNNIKDTVEICISLYRKNINQTEEKKSSSRKFVSGKPQCMSLHAHPNSKKIALCSLYKAKPWLRGQSTSISSKINETFQRRNKDGNYVTPVIQQESPTTKTTSGINEFRKMKPKNTGSFLLLGESSRLLTSYKNCSTMSHFQGNSKIRIIDVPVEVITSGGSNSRNISQRKRAVMNKTKTNSQKFSYQEQISPSMQSKIFNTKNNILIHKVNNSQKVEFFPDQSCRISHSNYLLNVPLAKSIVEKNKNRSANIQLSGNNILNEKKSHLKSESKSEKKAVCLNVKVNNISGEKKYTQNIHPSKLNSKKNIINTLLHPFKILQGDCESLKDKFRKRKRKGNSNSIFTANILDRNNIILKGLPSNQQQAIHETRMKIVSKKLKILNNKKSQ